MKEEIHADFMCDVCKIERAESKMKFMDLPGFHIYVCKNCQENRLREQERFKDNG